jgi:hypothetical protein
MAFLDWIKERSALRQDVAQRPEPSWQKQPAQDQYNQVAQMGESDKATAREIGDRIKRATRHLQPGGDARPALAEDASGNGPHRQNQVNQDKQAGPLTPTDRNVGTTAREPANTPSPKAPENATPAQTPVRPPQRSRGGWER